MPFFLNADGTASFYEWNHSLLVSNSDDMMPYYSSLAGACHFGKVQATAFEYAIHSEPYYDGVEALAARSFPLGDLS